MNSPLISIVTPTFRRAAEVRELMGNISRQTLLPHELILVDGAPNTEIETEQAVSEIKDNLAFNIKYVRRGGGTAMQRNVGIDQAEGDFIAFIDDDVRLEKDFFQNIIDVYKNDVENKIGGVVGYRTNRHFDAKSSERWRWYSRLRLLTIYEPGHYDYNCGYPINNNLQPPFSGTRPVDFMTTACAVWRRQVFDSGIRFDPFFKDYGVLEDAHLSLRAGGDWQLLQCGDARCEELHSPNGRVNRRKIGYKSVVNYYFVFQDITGSLTFRHKFRFWRYQTFEYFRLAASAVRRRNFHDLMDLYGRFEGTLAVVSGRYKK